MATGCFAQPNGAAHRLYRVRQSGWGWIILGLLLILGAVVTNRAANSSSGLGKTSYGKWTQSTSGWPSRGRFTATSGGQLQSVLVIFGGLSISGGIAIFVKGRNRSGWDI
jgi:hypothetical protein